jgi:NAD(P)H-hydrate epimerase
MQDKQIQEYLLQLTLPKSNTHKGQNGKLLLIGGSELFHAASKWSLDIASKFVDMVFYSSVKSNNELIQKVKEEFWNGIVIERESIEDYVQEADCILIGPGMERNQETQNLVNALVAKYPDKKMVIDAGALQMINPQFFNKNHIITPHTKEMSRLEKKLEELQISLDEVKSTILLKNEVDTVTWFDSENQKQTLEISGGNSGMTKGGTGDVLAGFIAALYCTHSSIVSTVIGSYINKKAGEDLYELVGPYFNSSDLVEQVPKTLWRVLK